NWNSAVPWPGAGGTTAAGVTVGPDCTLACTTAGFVKSAGAEAGWTRLPLRAPHSSRTKGETPSRRSPLDQMLNNGPRSGADGAAVAGGVAPMLGAATVVSAAVTEAAGTVG